jgi:hypothetical protein
MKNIILIITLFVSIFIVGCSDIEVLESPSVNLGVTSKKTDIATITTTGGTITVKYLVTTGARYSVQVYKFAATEPAKTLPFTAESDIETKVYEFSDLENGIYDLTLTDISGTSIKRPLVIKR